MNRYEVRINREELEHLNEIAKKRYYTNRGINNPPSKLPSRYVPWQKDLVGCLGEYAAAKALGVEWEGKYFDAFTFREVKSNINDIKGYEVRTSDHPKARLIFQPEDLTKQPKTPYIFVHLERTATETLTATLVGWTTPEAGVVENNYWAGYYGQGAYYVDRKDLQRMEDLPKCHN